MRSKHQGKHGLYDIGPITCSCKHFLLWASATFEDGEGCTQELAYISKSGVTQLGSQQLSHKEHEEDYFPSLIPLDYV
eukprot:scaffold84559_cov14-Tisochrysis_lutea.AAC.1